MKLSVVVVMVSDTLRADCDTALLARCLQALDRQVEPPPMEIVVPHHAAVRGIDDVRRRFPHVRLVCASTLRTFSGRGYCREHHDELRAWGIRESQGEIVGFLEDHEVPDPRWCREVFEAHQADVAAVGGAIENGVDRALNWAVYFCDFGRYQNPVRAGDATNASDANVSYKKAALEAVAPVWAETYYEPEVNEAIVRRAGRLVMAPGMVVYQRRPLVFRDAMAERFVWGRSYGAGRRKRGGGPHRMAYALRAPLVPAVLLARMAGRAIAKRTAVGAFFRALPLTAALVSSWCAGEVAGYWTERVDAHRS